LHKKLEMKIIINDSYEDMSRAAAKEILELLEPLSSPLLCIASGDTPAGLYKEMVDQVNRKHINTSEWNYVGMD